jgi:hypothetical protein
VRRIERRRKRRRRGKLFADNAPPRSGHARAEDDGEVEDRRSDNGEDHVEAEAMERRAFPTLLGGLGNRVETDVPERHGHEDGEHPS